MDEIRQQPTHSAQIGRQNSANPRLPNACGRSLESRLGNRSNFSFQCKSYCSRVRFCEVRALQIPFACKFFLHFEQKVAAKCANFLVQKWVSHGPLASRPLANWRPSWDGRLLSRSIPLAVGYGSEDRCQIGPPLKMTITFVILVVRS